MITEEMLMKDLFGNGAESDTDKKIKDLPVNKILPYPNHYFEKINDWEGFVDSIDKYGILQPIIVREYPGKEGYYQLLAGHNRTEAAKEVGLAEIPAIVIEDIDDIQASVLVGLTNRQREHITDLEWGRTYRETYELLKKQGERNDLTSCHGDTKFRTDEILAEKYGVSARTIQRKMRLTYLIEPIANLVNDGELPQTAAIEISYISEAEQNLIWEFIQIEGTVMLNKERAEELKKRSHSDPLSMEVIAEILKPPLTSCHGDTKLKEMKYDIAERYFPSGLTEKKRKGCICCKGVGVYSNT